MTMTSSKSIYDEFDSSLVDLVHELNIEIIDESNEETDLLKELEKIQFLTENDFQILQKIIDDNAYRFKTTPAPMAPPSKYPSNIQDKMDPLVMRKTPQKPKAKRHYSPNDVESTKNAYSSRFHPYKHWRPWQRNHSFSQSFRTKHDKQRLSKIF